MHLQIRNFLVDVPFVRLQEFQRTFELKESKSIDARVREIFQAAVATEKREFKGPLRLLNKFVAVLYWFKIWHKTRELESNRAIFSNTIIEKVNEEYDKRVKKLKNSQFESLKVQFPFLKEEGGSDTVQLFRQDLNTSLSQFYLAQTAETLTAAYVDHLKERALAVYRDLNGPHPLPNNSAQETIAAVTAWIAQSERQEAFQNIQDNLSVLTPQIEQAKLAIQESKERLAKEEKALEELKAGLREKQSQLEGQMGQKKKLLGCYIETVKKLELKLSSKLSQLTGSLLNASKVTIYTGASSLEQLEEVYAGLKHPEIDKKLSKTSLLHTRLKEEFPAYRQQTQDVLTQISTIMVSLKQQILKLPTLISAIEETIRTIQTALTGQQVALATLLASQTVLQTELAAFADARELQVEEREPAPASAEVPALVINEPIVPALLPAAAPPRINYFEGIQIADVQRKIAALFNEMTVMDPNTNIRAVKDAIALYSSRGLIQKAGDRLAGIGCLQYAWALLSDPLLLQQFALCFKGLPYVNLVFYKRDARKEFLDQHLKKFDLYFASAYPQDELDQFAAQLSTQYAFDKREFLDLVDNIKKAQPQSVQRKAACKKMLFWVAEKCGVSLV